MRNVIFGLAIELSISVVKYYTSTTQFNCGIDLHTRQMYLCLMDRAGKTLLHTNVRHNDFNFFLKLVAPHRHDLAVCADCMFGWYRLADACQAARLALALELHCGGSKLKTNTSLAIVLARAVYFMLLPWL